jgi:hypothetical protein
VPQISALEAGTRHNNLSTVTTIQFKKESKEAYLRHSEKGESDVAPAKALGVKSPFSGVWFLPPPWPSSAATTLEPL